MGFVIVLLQTGVANVALVPQAERVGKGGESPGKREESLGEKSQSQDQQCEIEEDKYRQQRLPNTRIGKTAKKAKSAASLASSRKDAKETLAKPKSMRKHTRRRARRNEVKSKAKQSDLAIDETTGSASKPSAEKETTENTEENTTIETMPTTQAEQPGEMTNNPPLPRQWGRLEDHLLAVQCPMPGQQGAPCFGVKEISEFLRNWERMANKYQLSTATKIKSVVDYCVPEMKNGVKALMSMARRKVRDAMQATQEERQWRVFKEWALEQYINANSVQIRLMVDYLKALAAERDIRKDERQVEYYSNEFDDVVVDLVKMRRLTQYDRMVLFLEGLPVVFASGRGGAKISRPARHRTRGRGTKIRPRPAQQCAGPRTGNGAGDHLRGPTWGTATGPRRYLRCPVFFCGAPP